MNHVEAWKALFDGEVVEGAGFQYRLKDNKLEGRDSLKVDFRVSDWQGPVSRVAYSKYSRYTEITFEEAYTTPSNRLYYQEPDKSREAVVALKSFRLGTKFFKSNE